jgi:drug/metabolite transporter (DMT)-like permease
MSGKTVIDRSTILGLCAIVMWSTTIAFSRRIIEHIGPVTTGAAIHLTGGAVLIVGMLAKKGSLREIRQLPARYVWGCGTLFVACCATLLLAVGAASDRSEVLEVALVNYLWPALTLLLSLVVLSKKARWWLIPGTLLALGGVFLVVTHAMWGEWSAMGANIVENPIAYLFALAAAVTWALYSNLARRWAGNRAAGGIVSLFFFATGVVLLVIRLFHSEESAWKPRVVVDLLVLAVILAVAYLFWDIAMRRGNMVLCAAGSYLTPLLSTIVSCLYLHVMPGIGLWIGCVLLVVGSFVSWRSIDEGTATPAQQTM